MEVVPALDLLSKSDSRGSCHPFQSTQLRSYYVDLPLRLQVHHLDVLQHDTSRRGDTLGRGT